MKRRYCAATVLSGLRSGPQTEAFLFSMCQSAGYTEDDYIDATCELLSTGEIIDFPIPGGQESRHDISGLKMREPHEPPNPVYFVGEVR